MANITDPRADGVFDSVEDFIADAMRPSDIAESERATTRELDQGNHAGWYGIQGKAARLADVASLISTGWTDGLRRAEDARNKIDTSRLTPKDRRRRILRTDMGDAVDMGAVYAGRFNTAWTRATRQTGLGPQKVDILCNSICSGADDADVLFWRGAAVVSLVDALESAGYMVRVVVGFGGRHWAGDGSGRISCRITVKNYDMPMDPATASSVILPGFFRGLGHAWIGRRAPYAVYGVGISVEKGRTEEGEHFCSHEVRDLKTAQAWIESTIDKIQGDAPELAAA